MKKYIPENLRKFFRQVRAYAGAIRYAFPEKKLVIIGVTGTSGKSTTTSMIFHMLRECGLEAGMVSTVGAIAGTKKMDTGLHVTTPDPYELRGILAFMVKRKVKYVVLETSSHALAQGRTAGIKFDYAVYTNIKRDHLDWHGTWENYAASKAILAETTKPDGKIVLNREDKDMYDFMMAHLSKENTEKVITYSFNEILNISEGKGDIKFRLNDVNFTLPVIGIFNVENVLASINVGLDLGLSLKDISNAFKTFKGLKGRMQIMQTEPFLIIVDFAHNTDSLEQSLSTVKKLTGSLGKVINVFGSAGLRDVEKRYDMGEISAKYADVTVITSEDPRVEKLSDINDQIIEGAGRSGGKLVKRFKNTEDLDSYEINPKEIKHGAVFAFDEETVNSRYDAVRFAINIAKEGDVVILEGKGHEESLCFGTVEYPFTDQEAVKRVIEKK